MYCWKGSLIDNPLERSKGNAYRQGVERRRLVSDFKRLVDLIGGKDTHPIPTNAQRSGVSKAFHIVDVEQFLIDGGTTAVGE